MQPISYKPHRFPPETIRCWANNFGRAIVATLTGLAYAPIAAGISMRWWCGSRDHRHVWEHARRELGNACHLGFSGRPQ
jgi:hypothetical protein